MLIVISPSKTINFKDKTERKRVTTPQFYDDATGIMSQLTGFNIGEIAALDKTSFNIAHSTYEFIHTFSMPSTPDKEAVFAYSGNVYAKLNAGKMDSSSIDFLQNHLRIFSALYGILRPLDTIKPYRLDMSSKLIPQLYPYWRKKVTSVISELLENSNFLLVNLASAEYFKMLDLKTMPAQTRIITPIFQQEIKGKLTTNSLFAKQARGLMLRFIAENKITDPLFLQAFDSEGYFYSPNMSGEDEWYFIR